MSTSSLPREGRLAQAQRGPVAHHLGHHPAELGYVPPWALHAFEPPTHFALNAVVLDRLWACVLEQVDAAFLLPQSRPRARRSPRRSRRVSRAAAARAAPPEPPPAGPPGRLGAVLGGEVALDRALDVEALAPLVQPHERGQH